VRSFHVANVTGVNLRGILVTNAHRGSWLMTDDHAGYKAVGKEFVGHGVVKHLLGEYVRSTYFHSTRSKTSSRSSSAASSAFITMSARHTLRVTRRNLTSATTPAK
jgi:hypothetical protein